MQSILNVFVADLRKTFIEYKRYLVNTIVTVITFYIVFIVMFWGISIVGDPNGVETDVKYVIVSYLSWFFIWTIVQGLSFIIMDEAQRGTLEQLYMSPYGALFIFLSRLTSIVLYNIVITGILLFASMITTNVWLDIKVMSLFPIFLITLLSVIGVSLMLGGLAIILKQIGGFFQILQFVFMGIAFISSSVSPLLLFAPTVFGIDLIRSMMMNDINSVSLIDYLILLANGLIYLIIGIIVFNICQKFARKNGLLGHY